MGRKIIEANDQIKSEKKLKQVGFYIRKALKPDINGNYTSGHADDYEKQLQKTRIKHDKKIKELEKMNIKDSIEN